MGEAQEEKKPEEKNMEEEKKPEEPKKEEAPKPDDEKKSDEAPPPPPPPAEIILRVYMHCEGCAKKVRRCLRGFPGVEDVFTDCKTHKVVVKGEKADPLKVLERVQKKSHRQVELLSPIPKPPAPEEPKKVEEKDLPKPEEPKEVPQVIIVALKVHMHCEACAQEIKRRILKMKGVEKVDADLKISQVTVKGIFDPSKLLEYVYKRTGKQAVILKQEPEKKEEVEKAKEENKGEEEAAAPPPAPAPAVEEEKKDGGGEETKEKKEGDDTAAPAPPADEDAGKVVEVKKNEFYYYYPTNFQLYPPRFATEMYSTHPGYAPQMFSDENPNACSVM
ncbi:heavy metal-associated isoprenylated plant protein 7-like [Impatiens glandulifera]|uniref:heavy metal-associated isoprenylated plant protein 7-like n=1 Tax=Impatiens glandulifera TaxID=253017 RepID=UPI001FB14335|nr:heavy metal-associated isoprenylated plant protein 7-like [Impatiens glandulifera]